MRRTLRCVAGVLAIGALVAATACGDDGDDTDEPATTGATAPEAGETTDLEGTTVRMVTHDSFNLSEDVLDSFEEETGMTVELLAGGDAVSVVNQAILTAGNPQADVLFGIDNNQLEAAFEEELFIPYESSEIAEVRDDVQMDPDHRVTPVDVGDVCLNYDVEWFAEEGLDVPAGLEDLTDSSYEDLLVVQNPATSSPGLAFLLASIAEFGTEGYESFWEDLTANGVEVTDGWEQAYYGVFSGGSAEGNRPLVVSYATSPPAEVFFADDYEQWEAEGELPDEAPTGVIAESCYRQIEFAGILDGADNQAGAEALVDFLLSEEVQADIPLQMFVEPVREGTELPEVFTRYSVEVEDPLSVAPEEVHENRESWVETWRSIVLG